MTSTAVAQNLIGGEWTGEPDIERMNPARPGQLAVLSPSTNTQALDDAITAASAAQPKWSNTPLPARGAILITAGNILQERRAAVAEDLRDQIAELPEHVREQAERELARLERMGEQGPEAQTIRTYLDWLVAVPWTERSEENLDPVHTREVLDA